jgi:hypothetical protein
MSDQPILLSTPGRCGTHWLARLLRKSLPLAQEKTHRWNEPIMVAAMEDPVPDTLYLTHDPLAYFAPMLGRAQFVTIVRDPRDIVVSAAYYWISKMGDLESLKKLRVYWEAGIPDGADFDAVLATLKHNLHNRRWFDYWLHFRHAIPCYVVRYGDLHADAPGTMRALFHWLGRDVPDATLAKAIDKSRFERVSGGRALGEADPAHFYRRGIVGEWREHFTDAENADFCTRFAPIMEAFGYGQ